MLRLGAYFVESSHKALVGLSRMAVVQLKNRGNLHTSAQLRNQQQVGSEASKQGNQFNSRKMEGENFSSFLRTNKTFKGIAIGIVGTVAGGLILSIPQKKRDEEERIKLAFDTIYDSIKNERRENIDIIDQLGSIRIFPKIELITLDKLNSAEKHEQNSNILKRRLDALYLIKERIDKLPSLGLAKKDKSQIEYLDNLLRAEIQRVAIAEKISCAIFHYQKDCHDRTEAETAIKIAFEEIQKLNKLLANNKKDKRLEEYYTLAEKVTAVAYNTQGIIQREKGEKDKAIASFNSSIEELKGPEKKRDVGIVTHNKAFTLNDLGRTLEAIINHCQALESDRDYTPFLNGVAFGLHQFGEYKQSSDKYVKLLQIDRNNCVARINRAWLLLDMNARGIEVSGVPDRAQEALQECNFVLDESSNKNNNRYANYYRAISLAHLGKKSEAIEALEKLEKCFSTGKRNEVLKENISEIRNSRKEKVLIRPGIEVRYLTANPTHKTSFNGEQDVCEALSEIRGFSKI